MRNEFIILIAVILVSISFVTAQTSYQDCSIYGNCQPVKLGTPIDVNSSSINNSLYWQGHTGTDGSWLTNIGNQWWYNQSLSFYNWLSGFVFNYNQTYTGGTFNSSYVTNQSINGSYVPYTGATSDVDLGDNDLNAKLLTTTTDGTPDDRGLIIEQHNNGVQGALANFKKSRGTKASPTDALTSDFGMIFFSRPYESNMGDYTYKSVFGTKTTANDLAGNYAETLFFGTAGSGDASYPYVSFTPQLEIINDGSYNGIKVNGDITATTGLGLLYNGDIGGYKIYTQGTQLKGQYYSQDDASVYDSFYIDVGSDTGYTGTEGNAWFAGTFTANAISSNNILGTLFFKYDYYSGTEQVGNPAMYFQNNVGTENFGTILSNSPNIIIQANRGTPDKNGIVQIEKEVGAVNAKDLGATIVTNGDFTGSAAGWTLTGNFAYNSNNIKTVSPFGASTAYQSVNVVKDTYYSLAFTTTLNFGVAGGYIIATIDGLTYRIDKAYASADYSIVFRATSTGAKTLTFSVPAGAGYYQLDSVSIKPIQSGHMGAVNISAQNYRVNGLDGVTHNYNMLNVSLTSCWMNYTSGLLTWSNC